MKIRESMAAILLCTGLIIAFAATGCGGDDDDYMDCPEAFAKLQSPDCLNAVTAGIDVLRACVTACQGNEACEDGCEDDFDAATTSCEPAATILADECGCEVCGNNFEDCIARQDPAADCVNAVIDCLSICVSS